jgi:hypothetical protein
VRVTIMLADAAQAAEGKLYILGGGWSVTGPEPVPMAIALKFEVPWDQANRPHHWELELIDSDGNPVIAPTMEGEQAVQIGGDFEVGRPPGLPAGTPLDLPLAINIGPLPLTPASRYVWRLWVDGDTDEGWQVAFSTRPPEQPPPI